MAQRSGVRYFTAAFLKTTSKRSCTLGVERRDDAVARRGLLLDVARLKGMSELSIWAIQRDNGGCPGGRAANDCSGIVQGQWAFSHLLQPFTR